MLDSGLAVWADAGGLTAVRQKELAEDVFLRFLVAWEYFLSEWFIGAINQDATAYEKDLQRRLREWHDGEVKRSPYSRFARFLPPPTVRLGKHPGLDQIRHWLDPHGRNVPFKDFDELEGGVEALHRRLCGRALTGARQAHCGQAEGQCLSEAAVTDVEGVGEDAVGVRRAPHAMGEVVREAGVLTGAITSRRRR